MKLQTVPFDIDTQKIAEGLLDLFTEDERIALRFGMLPAQKMESVQRLLRNKFLEHATSKDGDLFTAVTPTGRHIDFSMKKLVNEAMHEISLVLYGIGDLVV